MTRKPVQPRGQRRRESLLDAAAALLERAGYEAVNTNAIAEEAGAAVGTVYHYFPDKPALLAALLERYRGRLEQALMDALAPVMQESLEVLVEVGVRAFADFYVREPGYAELWLGSQLSGPLRKAGQRWGGHFARMFGRLIAQRRGLAPEDADRVALTFVHAISAVVSLAVERGIEERELLVREAIDLGQAYLAR